MNLNQRTNILTFARYYWPIEIMQNEEHSRKNWLGLSWNVLQKKIYIVQYVTSREPAQQACDHMLIIANFFDSILCIVMFPSDVIKVFLCEVMPSNI